MSATTIVVGGRGDNQPSTAGGGIGSGAAATGAAAGAGADQRDRSEFAKFCKFFTIRVVQVVVQSRTGGKLRSRSRVVGQPTDWFNVNIEEIGEVNEELKRALDGQYLCVGSPTRTISIVISLRTVDGDTLHLEIWQLSLNTEKCDRAVSVRSHLYHRLSVLLRSAIAASRTTPAYKLYARRQGAESFVLRYQISSAPVQLQVLGDGARTVDLGFVASPFAAVKLAVHYRTKMVISDSPEKLSGTLRENYYDTAGASASVVPARSSPSSASSARDQFYYDEQRFIDALPLAPLSEPNPYKAPPPLPDYSPTFSTFSTSPLSSDFPFTPSPVRRPSGGVAFHLGGGGGGGGGATSCSSSEDGGNLQATISGAVGPLVPRSRNSVASVADDMPKRNSSGTLFKMEMSGAGAGPGSGSGSGIVGGGGGSVSPKPSSSFPDHEGIVACRVGGSSRGSLTTAATTIATGGSTIRRDTFPFAQLLPSNSAPTFGGGLASCLPPGHHHQQYHLLHYGSLTGGLPAAATVTVAGAGMGAARSVSSTAVCKYSPKRRAFATFLGQEKPGSVRESDENLESSREVMVADGVKIVEKRRTRKGKRKDKYRSKPPIPEGSAEECAGAAVGESQQQQHDRASSGSGSDSESSCDDSFVRYEIRPVFASGSDLGAFFHQCKSAPSDLKSFMMALTQQQQRQLMTGTGVAAAAFASAASTASADATGAAAVVGSRGSLEDISERLKQFEEKQKVFDDFVKSLKVDSSGEEEEDADAERKN